MIGFPAKIINAAGPLSWLGGGPVHPAVLSAMSEASKQTVDMPGLQMWADGILSDLIGCESAMVTAGAFAGMVLSAAAVMAGTDFRKMSELPHPKQPRKIVIHRSQRNAYDRAWLMGGAEFLEIGFSGPPGTGATELWQLEEALRDPGVCAVAYAADEPGTSNALPLVDVVKVSHEHQRPVMVDAAAVLPPLQRLTDLLQTGADLVAVSGGKALGGPQNSGLLLGRKGLINSARMQWIDCDIDSGYAEKVFAAGAGNGELPNGRPHHGIGRGFKVSREVIVGTVEAARRFLTEYAQIEQAWKGRLTTIERALASVVVGSDCALQRDDRAWGGPVLRLKMTPNLAKDVSDKLRAGDPRIEVGRHALAQGIVTVSPLAMRDEDVEVLARRVSYCLKN
ncbi:aminotransferase class V-fold PLP-dependent enzyme [Alicyclobacillus tolerans]|uniref:aminotransferase class V-fold PLP-dependent enzyme n=1 Tax=Alicyclobacillus tolerans TaxID=90970 RepID=UPI001F468FFD|nr:aminotransferase class V-fold PLP-dependent enzyme [Alicyclobacillus tolerans]MCF8567464.1 aminotransferase class V-fold PLP-dependent enzyme [Alicyclobacillus tolerans]